MGMSKKDIYARDNLCIACGKPLSETSTIHCSTHQVAAKKQQAARRAKLKDTNLCISCCCRPRMPGRTKCTNCAAAHRRVP